MKKNGAGVGGHRSADESLIPVDCVAHFFGPIGLFL